jgi:hypothetical protein
MGTNAAVAFANLFMLSLENDAKLTSTSWPFFYGRYIDDSFAVFIGSEPELKVWMQHMNTMHPNIKFNWEYSRTSAVILDLEIQYDSDTGCLSFHTYTKPINRFQYLPYSSAHPTHVFKGWIKAELVRHATHCSSESAFKQQTELFFSRLLERGYPPDFLDNIFSSVCWSDRFHILRRQSQQSQQSQQPHTIVPSQQTFVHLLWNDTCRHADIAKQLNELYSELMCWHPELKERLGDLVVGFLKPKSLGSTLIINK